MSKVLSASMTLTEREEKQASNIGELLDLKIRQLKQMLLKERENIKDFKEENLDHLKRMPRVRISNRDGYKQGLIILVYNEIFDDNGIDDELETLKQEIWN